jgi:serine/threonine-protein kinase
VEDEYVEPPLPPRRDIWPWLAAAAFAALALIFLFLWLTDRGPKTAKVPTMIGLPQRTAETQASQRGFVLQTQSRVSTAAPGVVLDQVPQAGASLSKGSKVGVIVSAGKAQVAVPLTTGLKVDAAQRLLQTAGLVAQKNVVASDKPAGTVLSQNPAAGAKVAKGTQVTLSVAQGPKLVVVPALQGLSVDNATSKLQAVGLVAVTRTVPSAEPAGTVVAQNPPRLQKVKAGTKVELNVSQGKTPTTTVTTQSTTVSTVTVATTATTATTTTTP